jgi:hypothetical protein
MKSRIAFLIFISSQLAFANLNNRNTPITKSETPAIVVAGDSWAFLPCLFESVESAFESRNLDVDVAGCLSTSFPGARAENFKSLKAYKRLLALVADPNIRAVYLSLGGNDMFNYWNKNMSSEVEHQLFEKIAADIREVVSNLHVIRPNLNILVSGYDYGYLYDQNPIKAYREIFENMGKPTAEEINSAFIRLSSVINHLTSDHTAFIQHYGLMHYYFGAPESNTPALQTLPPEKISSPSDPLKTGGDPTVRTCPQAMLHIANWYVDPHHLSPTGFELLIGHSIDQYLARWLGY